MCVLYFHKIIYIFSTLIQPVETCHKTQNYPCLNYSELENSENYKFLKSVVEWTVVQPYNGILCVYKVIRRIA